jgi:hypothetical protein
MQTTKRILIAFLLLLFGVSVTAQEPVLSTEAEIKSEFEHVPCKNKERLPAVRALFEKMGATAQDISIEKHNGTQNLVVTMKGTEPGIVVVGAHYDLIEKGCGAIDNWTGIVSIAHTFRSVKKLGVKKTALFVAFGNEEVGLRGSHGMVQDIKKVDLPNYCAMINIDSFGMGRPFAMRNASSVKLSDLAAQKSEVMGIPFYEVSIPEGDSDSSSFLARGIPAVTLSGLSINWMDVLHTKKDQTTGIIHASVYFGYRLALATWAAVDAAPCDAFRDEGPRLK